MSLATSLAVRKSDSFSSKPPPGLSLALGVCAALHILITITAMISCVITFRTVVMLDIAAFLLISGSPSHVVHFSTSSNYGFVGFLVKMPTSGRNRGEILTARLVLDRGSSLLASLAAGDDE